MIEIYYGPPSIYGRKVLTVLMEKNLSYQTKILSFKEQDHLKPEYLKLNPNGEVPTLVDNGRVLYESTAIIEYLNDQYPEPPLMPKEAYERAKVRMIDDFCDLHLYRAVRKMAIKFRKKEAILDEDIAETGEGVRRMEEYFGGKKFMVEDFSLADCAFMPVIPSLIAMGFGKTLERGAPFTAYVEKLKSRASYKGAAQIS